MLYKCRQCAFTSYSFPEITKHEGEHLKDSNEPPSVQHAPPPSVQHVAPPSVVPPEAQLTPPPAAGGGNFRMLFHCQLCGQAVPGEIELQLHLKTIHKVANPSQMMHIGAPTRAHIVERPEVPQMIPVYSPQQQPATPPQQPGRYNVIFYMGKRIYACTQCDYQTPKLPFMYVHERVHTNERKYSCNICGKRFKQSSHLSQHKSIHSANKDFKCSKCPSQFNFASNLYAHMKKHHGIKPTDAQMRDIEQMRERDESGVPEENGSSVAMDTSPSSVAHSNQKPSDHPETSSDAGEESSTKVGFEQFSSQAEDSDSQDSFPGLKGQYVVITLHYRKN